MRKQKKLLYKLVCQRKNKFFRLFFKILFRSIFFLSCWKIFPENYVREHGTHAHKKTRKVYLRYVYLWKVGKTQIYVDVKDIFTYIYSIYILYTYTHLYIMYLMYFYTFSWNVYNIYEYKYIHNILYKHTRVYTVNVCVYT